MQIESITYRHFLLLLIALLSVWARVDHRYHYLKLNPDTEIIMATAAHIEQGRGGVLDHWNAADISQSIELEQRATMPGYTYLLLAIKPIAKDWLKAAWWIEIGAILAFFAGIILWFKRLMGETASLELGACLLLLGFSPAPMHYFPTTDMLSLTAFIWGAYGLYRIQDKMWLYGGLSLLGLGLAVSFRYAYLPLLGLLPLILHLRWWQRRDAVSLWGTLISIPSIVLVAFILLGLKGFAGSMAEAVRPQLYITHLAWLEPFFFKSFFYYGLPHELSLNGYWEYASLALKIAAFVASAWLVMRLIRFSDNVFNTLFFLTSLLVILLLSYFSVRVPAETWNQIQFWTFLMETRYYAAPMILVVIGIFAQMRKGKGRRWMQAFLVFAILAGASVTLFQKYRIYVQQDISGTFAMSSAAEIYRSASERETINNPKELLYNSEDSRIGELFGFVSVPMEVGLDSLQSVPRSDSLRLYAFFSVEDILTPAENAWQERSDTEQLEKNTKGEWWLQKLYPNMD